MKDKKRYLKNLFILIIGLVLISCSSFASDKIHDIRIALMLSGPILSPSGDKIAFDFIWRRNDETGAAIGILLLKNDEIRIVSTSVEGSLNEYSTWSKDSKHILFRSSKEDGYRLVSINLETLKQEVLAFLQYDENYENREYIEIPYLYPIWFPLSDKVVFIKQIFDRETTLLSGYVFDLKEKKEREIVKGISDSIMFRLTLSVSYNGEYVFYTKKANKYNDIWLSGSHKDNSGEERLTKGYNVTYLRPSPVKNEIFFISSEKDKNSWALHRLDITTRKKEKLLKGNNYNFGYPSWSQDGSLIVFINDKNIISILDVKKRKVIGEIKTNMETIAFPLLVKNRSIIFYHKNSIWSVDTGGKNLREIFPMNFERELKELKGFTLPEK